MRTAWLRPSVADLCCRRRQGFPVSSGRKNVDCGLDCGLWTGYWVCYEHPFGHLSYHLSELELAACKSVAESVAANQLSLQY